MARKKKPSKLLKLFFTKMRLMFFQNKRKPQWLSKHCLFQILSCLLLVDAIFSLLLLGYECTRGLKHFALYISAPFFLASIFNVILEVALISSRSKEIGLLNFYCNLYSIFNLSLSFTYAVQSFEEEMLKVSVIVLKLFISYLMGF